MIGERGTAATSALASITAPAPVPIRNARRDAPYLPDPIMSPPQFLSD